MASAENHPSAPYLSVPEAARFLGVGRRVVYELIERGEVTAVKGGGATLVERRSLEAFKAAGRLT